MENNILSIVNYNHYSPPDGFCFDDNCHDRYDPIRADKRLEDYNVDKKANELVRYFRNMQNQYLSDKILMHTFGDDFCFANAHKNFK